MDKIIAKKALTPNDCQLTESESNECPEFATSKAKANTNASIADKTNTSLAIAKLCTYIGDKPTREAINTTLTSYTPAEVRAFFADVLCNNNISNAPDNTRSMCNFVNNFTVAIVEAWKICKDARPTTSSIRLDWDILQSVVDYSNNPNLQAGLTITKTTDTTPNRFLKILKEYSGECNTCLPGNATVCERLPKMNIYLNRLKRLFFPY